VYLGCFFGFNVAFVVTVDRASRFIQIIVVIRVTVGITVV
jgi:hypothetical protein